MIALSIAKSAVTADGAWTWCETHMVRTWHTQTAEGLVCDECNRSNADTPALYSAVSANLSPQPGEAA